MTHDFSIFFSTESIIIFILVFSRLTAMLHTAPLISTFPIPAPLKVGLGGLCAFIIYPFVLQSSPDFVAPKDLISLSVLLGRETAIGVLIGFSMSLIFTAIEIGGQILGIQMSLAVASALDPVTRQQTPVIGQFYLFMASITFLLLNGTHWLFTTVYDSFKSIPVGMDFSFSGEITQQLLYFAGQLFLIAFSIIIPIFSILFIKTVLMGIVAKIMPQLNIFMVAMPIQIYVGLVLMLILMPHTAVYLSKLINELLTNINSIFV